MGMDFDEVRNAYEALDEAHLKGRELAALYNTVCGEDLTEVKIIAGPMLVHVDMNAGPARLELGQYIAKLIEYNDAAVTECQDRLREAVTYGG